MLHNKKHKAVSTDEAKANSSYWKIVENSLKQRAINTIYQYRLWQEHNIPLSLPPPIMEPFGNDQAKFYALLIQAGMWLDLDFNHPDFTRILFKALRLNLIDQEQLVTALLLQTARENFAVNAIKQYKFHDKKGPFHLSQLELADKKAIQDFYVNLKKLPQSMQNYFVINFSAEQEALFFAFGLLNNPNLILKNKKYNQLFLHYTKRFLSKNPANPYLNELCANLNQGEANQVELNEYQISKVVSQFLTAELNFQLLHQFNYSSESRLGNHFFNLLDMLIVLIEADMDFPILILSPDWVDNQPTTPLIAMVLPTICAFENMKAALTRADNAELFFTTGTVTTRIILKSAKEQPPKRPIEIFHPDIEWKGIIHNRRGKNKFASLIHDLTHAMIHSINPFQRFNLYLIEMLQQVTGFDLSHTSWEILDKSISTYKAYRIAANNQDSATMHTLKVKFINKLFLAGIKIVNPASSTSQLTENWSALIIIADMIINPDRWQHHLGLDYKQLLADQHLDEHLKNILIRMKDIINCSPKALNLAEPIKYYALKYQLSKTKGALNLGDLLIELPDFNQKILWKKDSKTNEIYLSVSELYPNTHAISLTMFENIFNVYATYRFSQLKQASVQETEQVRRSPKF